MIASNLLIIEHCKLLDNKLLSNKLLLTKRSKGTTNYNDIISICFLNYINVHFNWYTLCVNNLNERRFNYRNSKREILLQLLEQQIIM